METTYSPPQAEPTFPSQVPFSWTLRWAKAHRSERTRSVVREYRIAGSAANDDELAAAVAFCELHGATPERV